MSNLSDRGTLRASLREITDYNPLINKPSVNHHILIGDKSGHDLGLANIDDVINVIANPTGEVTEDLVKLEIGNIIYQIPEGTKVIANPEGTSSENLNLILIGNTIYKIPEAKKDVLYINTNGAPHLTWLTLAHNINDYDIIYLKISNPTDIANFNIYTHHSFMPIMYDTTERVSIQGLYGTRVVDIAFNGDEFQIVRTDGDVRNNTIYEIVGIKC